MAGAASRRGIPTVPVPALTAPGEVSGKAAFGFNRSRVCPILNAAENPPLKDKENKQRDI